MTTLIYDDHSFTQKLGATVTNKSFSVASIKGKTSKVSKLNDRKVHHSRRLQEENDEERLSMVNQNNLMYTGSVFMGLD